MSVKTETPKAFFFTADGVEEFHNRPEPQAAGETDVDANYGVDAPIILQDVMNYYNASVPSELRIGQYDQDKVAFISMLPPETRRTILAGLTAYLQEVLLFLTPLEQAQFAAMVGASFAILEIGL